MPLHTTSPLTRGEAWAPVLVMVGTYGLGAAFLGSSGALLVVVLLLAAAAAGGIAARHGHGWDAIQRATGEKLASVLPALVILLAIGMLIAAWVLSGTIPYLVHWGIRLISPRWIVLTSFVATALMSLATGTSWGSAGTIGVALTGTAAALDAPLAATAGAIVSGAYLGDKMSPLSDSTNICAIGAGADLYRHVRHMTYTAAPSLLIATVVYASMSRLTVPPSGGIPDGARLLLADIERAFDLNPVVLLPAVIVLWSIVRRVPPALAIAVSSIVAAAIGVFLQGFSVGDAIAALVEGFRPEMLASAGVDPASVGPAFGRLVERGGLNSMATTLVVVLAAFLLAGAMEASGALRVLVEGLLRTVRSVFGLIAATMAAGATTVALTSHGGVTALIVGGLFGDAYVERDLAPENLSRSLEDSVTITEPLMPWTVSAVYMATTLGVPTTEYLPWAVFCYGGPLFSLLIAATWRRTGFGIRLSGPGHRPVGPETDPACGRIGRPRE